MSAAAQQLNDEYCADFCCFTRIKRALSLRCSFDVCAKLSPTVLFETVIILTVTSFAFSALLRLSMLRTTETTQAHLSDFSVVA